MCHGHTLTLITLFDFLISPILTILSFVSIVTLHATANSVHLIVHVFKLS